MTNTTNNAGKAYNVKVTQLSTAAKSQNSTGKSKITFRGSLVINGKTIERTVLAQGAAADAIASGLRKGTEQSLRVLFSQAPDNDDGSQGGQFLTVVGVPRAAAA